MTKYSSWEEIVRSFPSTPFLFIGSGLSRRYLNLPNWDGLLSEFSRRISSDPLKFQELKLKSQQNNELIGSILEKEFNDLWFSDKSFRTNNDFILNHVYRGVSPFKAEVAFYIKNNFSINNDYLEEIEILKSVTENNISGIITTNYDDLPEIITRNYKTYQSQDELITSSPQNIGEIFKIHGSIEDPKTIVITQSDYADFDRKSQYLAAKLLTIFMEYPIIFIGYSISDSNIRKILTSIVECFSDKRNELDFFEKRLFLIQHSTGKNKDKIQVSKHSIDISGTLIPLTRIDTDNFKELFSALKYKKTGYPVRLLRFLKESLCRYTISDEPQKHFLVTPYDNNVPDESLVFSLGIDSTALVHGLIGITAEQWYKDIIFNDLKYSSDDLLDHTYNQLLSHNNKLPIFKHLSKSTKPHKNKKLLEQINETSSYDSLLNASIIRSRDKTIFKCDRSIKSIREFYGCNDLKIEQQITLLRETEINVEDLKDFLKDLFLRNPDVLVVSNKGLSTEVRRLIRIYDWLIYHRKRKGGSSQPRTSL